MSLFHARLEQPLHVLADNVGLEVYPAPGPELLQVRVRTGLGQYRDRKRALPHRHERQAYPVDADAALLDTVAQHRFGRPELPDLRVAFWACPEHPPNAVHVPLHDVSPEPAPGGHRPLEVDGTPRSEATERRTPERFGHGEEAERPAIDLADGQASPVHTDALAGMRVLRDSHSRDAQAQHLASLERRDTPNFLNKPGEHVPPLCQGRALRPRHPLPSRLPRPRTAATPPPSSS